jgi:hypothetical protein
MEERMIEQLKNLPYSGDDAFKELEELLEERVRLEKITEKEQARLSEELSVIKKLGIAKSFLFARTLCKSECKAITLGVEGYSYVNYLLGVSIVNPVLYDLPFERYFSEHKKFLLTYNFCVEEGNKGKLLKAIQENYGQATIIKSKEDNDSYFISTKLINKDLIKEKRIVVKTNQEAYVENVSALTYIELIKLGFYVFSVNEVKSVKQINEGRFLEADIYERAKSMFPCQIFDEQAFDEIEQVKDILCDTESKLVYQEQLIKILNELFGMDLAEADYFRRELVIRRDETLEKLKGLFTEKYGEKGQRLLKYVYKNCRRLVAKAYVIANLQANIEY